MAVDGTCKVSKYCSVAKTIASQLLEAWQRSDLTLAELLTEARLHVRRLPHPLRSAGKQPLDCDFTSLSRKLHGKQILTTAEAEALAKTLGVSIAWGPETKARAS
jgi:hypothetical protein